MRKQYIIIAAGLLATICLLTAGAVIILNHSDANQEEISQIDNYPNARTIDLNQQSTDLEITEAGSYRLTGQFAHSIIVNAPSENVELILDNAEITASETAAIAGRAAQQLKITLASGSSNTLRDGGSSDYDGCIFSNAELIFDGDGTLFVHGEQTEGEGIATEAQNMTFNDGTYYVYSNDDGLNAGGDGATITINGGNFYIDAGGDGIDSNRNAVINGGTIFVIGSDIGGDAGIDTDDGFTINGGTVIALGSDMLEAPLASSTQNSLAMTLGQRIEAGEIVSLWRDDTEVISFVADKSFQTLLVSLADLTEGTYQLYTGGSHSGEIEGGIYTNGTYTKGASFNLGGTSDFQVQAGVNEYGQGFGGNMMPGAQRPAGSPPTGGNPPSQPPMP